MQLEHHPLRHIFQLNLSEIQLRYNDDARFPSLINIYELIHPITVAISSISQNLVELKEDRLREGAVKGIFVLGVANFETMLGDLLIRILSFYPQKLSMLSSNHGEEFQESFNIRSTLYDLIKMKVHKLGYSNLQTIYEKFHKIFAIDQSLEMIDLKTLIEIKETRNLLIHNNLVVNEIYREKVGEYTREEQRSSRVSLDCEYAIQSLNLIMTVIKEIEKKILLKYGKFTFVALIKRMWELTFPSHIGINNHLDFDYDLDYFKGHFKDCSFPYASSEKFYLQFWKGQREGSSVERFAFVHIGSPRVAAFLTEIFCELHLPYACT